MKSCPVCNRTFDDTLTFCLDDGSLLSPPLESEATVTIPARPDPVTREQETVVRTAGQPEQETVVAVARKQPSKRPLIFAGIFGGAFVLLVLVAGLGFFGLKYYQMQSLGSRDTPSGAVRALSEAIKKKDVEGLKRSFGYKQLASFEEDAKKENLSLDAFLKKELDLKPANFAIQDVRNEKVNGNKATVEVEMQDEWETWDMEKDNGEWKYVPSGSH